MMKKIALVLALTVITAYTTNIGFTAPAKKGQTTVTTNSTVYNAIGKYKHKNYTGVIQDLTPYLSEEGKYYESANNKLKNNSLAYYYYGLSYTQLGFKNEARDAFNKVLEINDSQKLVEYSTRAVACIDGKPECSPNYVDKNAPADDEMTVFIKSGKFLDDGVKQQIQEKALDKLKDQINNDTVPDTGNYKFLNDASSEMKAQPTDKEIADAVKVLAKVGVNPFI